MRHLRDLWQSLDCTKINLLVRFAGLTTTTQHLHCDDEKFGLVVILVLKCNKRYPFTYVVESHELSYNGRICAGYNVVHSDKTTIQAPENHIICFATNLIHAGGPMSTGLGSDINVNTNNQLSDVQWKLISCIWVAIRGPIEKSGYTLAWLWAQLKETYMAEMIFTNFKENHPNFQPQ
jgi:hypothetical protein